MSYIEPKKSAEFLLIAFSWAHVGKIRNFDGFHKKVIQADFSAEILQKNGSVKVFHNIHPVNFETGLSLPSTIEMCIGSLIHVVKYGSGKEENRPGQGYFVPGYNGQISL